MNILQEMSPVQTLGGTDLELNLANELRVPKRKVMADVTFLYAGDRPQPCLFYLSFYSPRRSGEESLFEYLNSMHSFFPLRDKASGEFFIVHVNQVLDWSVLPGPFPRHSVRLHASRSRRMFSNSSRVISPRA